MTQKERQERSKEEIYRAAMAEFGSRGYDGANTVSYTHLDVYKRQPTRAPQSSAMESPMVPMPQ